jgi:hypothetical protein
MNVVAGVDPLSLNPTNQALPSKTPFVSMNTSLIYLFQSLGDVDALGMESGSMERGESGQEAEEQEEEGKSERDML